MLRGNLRQSGWRGASLVAITYVYFLIFAQFAFLNRLASLGVAGTNLKTVMAAMAAGGILFSLVAPRLSIWPSPNLRLRIGLLVTGAAAILSLLPLGLAASLVVSFLIGSGLALLTVTLVTHLRQWTGNRHPLVLVGLGTGTAYLVCNFPPFFTASPKVQSLIAGLLCLAGICITLLPVPSLLDEPEIRLQPAIPFLRALLSFAALVWLDSAAFFIIQGTPALKAGTWQGSVHLWANGLLHLAAALASAWLLSRRGLSFVLSASSVSLGTACWLLLDPDRALLASILYPVGVSLYSVALVAYPALIAPAFSAAERGRQAGWIYAIAGWLGSAMGIGMGQNLGHVPPAFVLGAGAVVLAPLLFSAFRQRFREAALTTIVVLAAFYIDRVLHAIDASPQLSQVERGRQVYIAEGCIHCHSQYVRPNSPDVLMWGPVESIEELRLQQPPLIGNRRQGPDLSQVGARRSALWLKAHFYDPAEVSGASIMPSFDILFRDGRGDDLVAYLESLHGAGSAQHIADQELWQPSDEAMREADPSLGERLFLRDCATCHSKDGHTRQTWSANFKRLPPDFAVGPFTHLSPADGDSRRVGRVAQIAKFGIPGTDMPGHEYLSDKQIASISLWSSRIIAQSNQRP
jgi:cbb3-type cytochrome oxidase cytochrome c subunit